MSVERAARVRVRGVGRKEIPIYLSRAIQVPEDGTEEVWSASPLRPQQTSDLKHQEIFRVFVKSYVS